MCGIAGFLDKSGEVGPEVLAAASRAIAHRGPDDAGTQIIAMHNGVGRVGLANRRLAILDLSPAGHQPMSDPATGNWIAYNGEIFNFREVREKLESRGAQFSSQTDTEVVLKAYAAFGENCLDHFRGMFAFAIWDNAEQRLFIARDRLGKKPLYYCEQNGCLLFASEVRAILATDLVPRRINPEAVQDFLCFGSVYDPNTLIEGVKALLPGRCLTWKAGEIDIKKYWDPLGFALGTQTAAQPDHIKDESEVVGRLQDLLTQAINLRMVSDVPVGVFLSGGIDSSVLVAALSNKQDNINTFSIVFKEGDYSEAKFSALVARRFSTIHHEITLTGEEFLTSIPEAIAAMDQPSVDGFNTFTISRAVARAGLKVALSGQGGDELFAGYNTFRTVPRMERLQRLERFLPSRLRSVVASSFPGRENSDRNRKLAALVEGNGFMVHPYFLSRMVFVPRQQELLMNNGNIQALRSSMAAKIGRAASLDSVNRVSYLELTNYMANTLLRDADCMSMANGLELRLPLLDHLLVEYVLSIPGAMKLDSHMPKHLLVKAMQGLLPQEIVHRPKQGFTFPFEHWMRGHLKASVESVLSRVDDGPLGRLLNRSAVLGVWQSFLEGKTSWSRPWSLYVLNRWCTNNV
jgi:asparagine synthase (glutamine-hydrolysing)